VACPCAKKVWAQGKTCTYLRKNWIVTASLGAGGGESEFDLIKNPLLYIMVPKPSLEDFVFISELRVAFKCSSGNINVKLDTHEAGSTVHRSSTHSEVESGTNAPFSLTQNPPYPSSSPALGCAERVQAACALNLETERTKIVELYLDLGFRLLEPGWDCSLTGKFSQQLLTICFMKESMGNSEVIR
jgi:hypothetical protein